MPAFDSFRVYVKDQDYTLPTAEADFDGVFRDLSLSSDVEALLTRWAFPVPVRAPALLFAAASLNTRMCVFKCGQTDLGFGNLLPSFFLGRCQVDFPDHRPPPALTSRASCAFARCGWSCCVVFTCSYGYAPEGRFVISV